MYCRPNITARKSNTSTESSFGIQFQLCKYGRIICRTRFWSTKFNFSLIIPSSAFLYYFFFINTLIHKHIAPVIKMAANNVTVCALKFVQEKSEESRLSHSAKTTAAGNK